MNVGSPIHTSSGAAPDCNRDAVFITSPMIGVPSDGTSTSPVVIPIRHASGIADPAFDACTRSCISMPAFTARRTSSSWETGRPNTATSKVSPYSRKWVGARATKSRRGEASSCVKLNRPATLVSCWRRSELQRRVKG